MICISGVQKTDQLKFFLVTILSAQLKELLKTLLPHLKHKESNEMIVSAEKFQATVMKKNAKMKDSSALNINDLTINSESSGKFIGIEIDNKLSFGQHIPTLCNKASNQLNAIRKNANIHGLEKKFFLIVLYTQTFINILLFGIFAHLNIYIKSKKTQKTGLYYYTKTSLVIMLNSSGKTTMEINPLQCLALEIFKTINLAHRSFNQNNTTKYGNDSLRSLEPHIRNYLPREIKKEKEYEKFKNYIND